ncbi:type IV secretory system conjugative DNA transfer family protein [uncultured Lacinutrix sp.]|uniref:type IV secretory system conjugative DNA transfer family protein n=1 Tax=uncultured Lacinutrix sp. TaxID=574032 RepID=UPI00261773C6|nr:type IV secretory system conjugative DNA transfer family protein [uncultured Lacinutrix sp.]
MKNTYSLFENAFELLVDGLEDLVAYLDPNKHRLKGQYMRASKILSRRNKGFNLNGKSISPKLSMQGVLVNGETGSFKTAGVVLRSVLTVNGSQILHDPSKELFEKTSGALAEKDYRILQLDFSSPKTSLRFNPMLRANTKSQITQLATNLVTIGSEDNADSFWNTKAIEVLYVLISILKTQDKQFHTLTNVAHLLDIMQSVKHKILIDHLFSKYADEELFVKYTSITSQSDNTFSSIVSTAQASIQIFALDENIAEITSSDTIGDFDSIRNELTALYLHSSTAKMRYYSKITSIFLSQYFESFFEELPTKQMYDVYFHLDETPILSIGSLDIIASNIRKYRGAIMCVCQNAQAQLTAKYGKRADAIISNLRTKVYLSADLNTATALECTLGRYEFEDKKDKDRLKSRAVLTADEIMSLPTNRALILVSGMRTIFARVKPYFKVRALRELSELPPYEANHIGSTAIKLLPLEELFPNVIADETN